MDTAPFISKTASRSNISPSKAPAARCVRITSWRSLSIAKRSCGSELTRASVVTIRTRCGRKTFLLTRARNYVRALFRTPRGSLLAGTNSGLFVQRETGKAWQFLPDVSRRIVYAISEDKNNRILIGTAAGLFVSAGELAFVRIKTPEERLPQGDSIRAIANVNGVTYIATYGYGVEKLE